METPTLEEVREYFKNAKKVHFNSFNYRKLPPCGFDLSTLSYDKNSNSYYCNEAIIESENIISDILMYDCNLQVYAEIIEFKEPTKETPENEFKQITDSISDLLEYKNKKYGRSALKPIKIFEGKTKVGQRLDDKISRVKNSDVLRKNDIADIIGYLVLVCKENNWNDFSEFKD